MKRILHLDRRNRLRLTLLVVLSLLFQQVAFAAYVCGSSDMPAGNVAMHAHCDGMPMAQQKQSPALCAQHCAQQSASTQDVRLPNVSPLLLPALAPAQSFVQVLPASAARRAQNVARRLSGIPPTLQFRVLLI